MGSIHDQVVSARARWRRVEQQQVGSTAASQLVAAGAEMAAALDRVVAAGLVVPEIPEEDRAPAAEPSIVVGYRFTRLDA